LTFANSHHWSVLYSWREKEKQKGGVHGVEEKAAKALIGVVFMLVTHMAGVVGIWKRRAMHSITGTNSADADESHPARQGSG